MKEIWKPFFNGYYAVSNYGRICRIKAGGNAKAGMFIRQQLSKGYWRFQVQQNHQYKNYFTHVLVARKFIGPCPKGKEVNHKDLDKDNNRVDNLEYMTRKQNIAHALRNGVIMAISRGENHGNAILSEKDVVKIRFMFATGKYTYRELAKKFGLNDISTIGHIARNRIWKHVGGVVFTNEPLYAD